LADPIVLDSSAVLAVFLNEPGGEIVIPVLRDALLSTVNLAEVHAQMLDYGVRADHAWSRMESVQFEICFFTAEQARIAAELRSITRPFGLSLGDRACLALAIDRKATVYTTDRVWAELGLGIQVEVIR
jgi:PIN domain nuclease of toxin-antitoxin system